MGTLAECSGHLIGTQPAEVYPSASEARRMDEDEAAEEEEEGGEVRKKGDGLINEAIKRILLDIVVRGHGDRLIGRWSREPDLQRFLEQVPYLLDRINQLHLACARTSKSHQHRHQHHHRASSLRQSSLADFISLIGDDRHWLVRSRDSLGLTPLHKAVLFNNRPIVEYILDRYPEELAATSWRALGASNATTTRLFDAQDKYGRTALHYAAASHNVTPLYHFLILKGASLSVKDFRGKTPAYYVRHPNELRFKSIIHLANKLNANYQANVLSRTLRANSELSKAARDSQTLSASCGDLSKSTEQQFDLKRTQSNLNSNSDFLEAHRSEPTDEDAINRVEICSLLDEHIDDNLDLSLKKLVAERASRKVLDQSTRERVQRCLKEGIVDKVNELLVEGFGQLLLDEAQVLCWNQQCKRYINNVVPLLLAKTDKLHEAIATNQLLALKSLLNSDPILARIRRPYKRASMSALHLAVSLDRRDLVKFLADDFSELITQPDSNGATCLHWAARSLRLERLYCWLIEHFGPQLEHLRDFRNKTAADYRQQAIRMSSLEARSSFGQVRSVDANDILKRNQIASNKLQLRGARVELKSKLIRGNQKASSSSKPPIVQAEPQNEETENEAKEEPARKDSGGAFVECLEEASIRSGSSSEVSSNAETLLMAGVRNLPEPPNGANSSQLQEIISEAIQNADYKKLEHLILAGCGERLEEAFNESKVKEEQRKEMEIFFKTKASACMEQMSRIKQVLHAAFANSDCADVNVNFHKLCNLFTRKRLIVCRDSFGATPLQIALMRCDRRLVEYILRRHPEAASAPDQEARNALHYAALVCAFFGQHGATKLTAADSDPKSSGFWLIDENCKTVFCNLSQRYADLLEVKDKSCKTASDYLQTGENASHLDLSLQPAGLLAPSSVVGCCEDYAKLLIRYNYLIVVEPKSPQLEPSEESGEDEPDEAIELEEQREEAVELAGSPVEPTPQIIEQAEEEQTQVGENHKGHHKSGRTLLDNLDPNVRPSSNKSRKHHHHTTRGRSSATPQSIVGGVIVPTIIHNDKMDEIETYDIIYRQPVVNTLESSESSFSSEPDEEAVVPLVNSASPRKSRRQQQAAGRRDSSSSSSSGGSSDDDADRVERLSNEFESRVRREKSELQAKVDQIMSEIKTSAKSGKSSRFLASPGGAGPSTVQFALNSKERPSSSLCSSKGSNSSSQTSSSSGCSRTSCCSSSCSSASSSNRTAKTGARELQSPHLADLACQVVSKNTFGQTYLHFVASRSQSSSTLYKVLKHGSHLIGERDVFYRTARDVALQFNLANNVQVLDKFIIDLFIGGKTNLLRHLLNQGYSPLIHVADPDGNDIMLILKLLKLDRMIHFLLQMADFQRWRDELHTFIRHGYSAGVSELIKKHKDLVSARSVQARCSLHLAVLFERLEMIPELLETDPSSVFCTDNMGRTALHYVYGLHGKNMETIRDKLVACGASSDCRDVKMRTPKYYYIFKREIEDIKRIELELS